MEVKLEAELSHFAMILALHGQLSSVPEPGSIRLLEVCPRLPHQSPVFCSEVLAVDFVDVYSWSLSPLLPPISFWAMMTLSPYCKFWICCTFAVTFASSLREEGLCHRDFPQTGYPVTTLRSVALPARARPPPASWLARAPCILLRAPWTASRPVQRGTLVVVRCVRQHQAMGWRCCLLRLVLLGEERCRLFHSLQASLSSKCGGCLLDGVSTR